MSVGGYGKAVFAGGIAELCRAGEMGRKSHFVREGETGKEKIAAGGESGSLFIAWERSGKNGV